MKLSFSDMGSFSGLRKWADKVNGSNRRILDQLAPVGIRSLSSNTPVGKTGETAKSWKANIQNDELSYTNFAHPEERVNIAKIKDTGHGTGNGGYVPPKPYIKRSMKPVYQILDSTIRKEIT